MLQRLKRVALCFVSDPIPNECLRLLKHMTANNVKSPAASYENCRRCLILYDFIYSARALSAFNIGFANFINNPFVFPYKYSTNKQIVNTRYILSEKYAKNTFNKFTKYDRIV